MIRGERCDEGVRYVVQGVECDEGGDEGSGL